MNLRLTILKVGLLGVSVGKETYFVIFWGNIGNLETKRKINANF